MSSGQFQLILGLGTLVLYLLFLIAERAVLKTARHHLGLVIHVNGTRGKSTVTRMIHALLREAGYQAWGKTTGTEPRLLLPDGGERLIRRLGPANVREQRNMLLRAVRGGADALVFECNAVRPELQLVSSAFLDPDLLVITNARLDHRSEQGDAEAAALSYAATIPAGRAVATSDSVHRSLWEREASARSAPLVYVDPSEGGGYGDLPENVACAFAVADWLGLARDRAARAISAYKADPGVFRLLSWIRSEGQRVWFADALAANDPESSDRLAKEALTVISRVELASRQKGRENDGGGSPTRILLVALRRDRPERTRLFVDYAVARSRGGKSPAELGTGKDLGAPADPETATAAGLPVFDEVLFIGSIPPGERLRLGGAGLDFKVISAKAGTIRTGLEQQLASRPGPVFVFAAGNRVGSGRIIHEWATEQAAKAAQTEGIAGSARAVASPVQEACDEP